MTARHMSAIDANDRAASEGRDEPNPVVFPVVFIVGAGVVGSALAACLARAGVPVAGLHGRQLASPTASDAASGILVSTGDIPPVLSESDVVIICVRDQRIAEVAARLVGEQRLRPRQVVLHSSGAHASADVLAIARPHVRAVGTLHPLVSFAGARAVGDDFQSVAFGIEGDQPAKAAATRLVRALGGQAVFLEAENLPLYHVAAVMASNYMVALTDLAQGLLIKAGVPREQALPALIPLLSSVVNNLTRMGLPGALTGPVERGDVSSVALHVRTLAERAPELLDLYRLLGRNVLRLAREKSPLAAAAVTQLESLLGLGAPAGGTTGVKVPE